MSTTLKNRGFSTRNLIGIALIGIVLAVLPFVLGMAGQAGSAFLTSRCCT